MRDRSAINRGLRGLGGFAPILVIPYKKSARIRVIRG
jgi:hypothetical protein